MQSCLFGCFFFTEIAFILSFMTKVMLDNSSLNVSRRGYELLQLEIRKVNYVR